MCNSDRDECFKVTKKLIDKIKDRVTGTICHYTGIEGFKGIIKSKEIWMTNALFVNDRTELRTSLAGKDDFNDVNFTNPGLFDVFKNIPKLFGAFENNPQKFESKDVEDYYLASFSRDDNSLDQFRAYGNYCIGFDVRKLKKNTFSLFRCVYKNSDLKKWIIRKDKLKEWKNSYLNNTEGEHYKKVAFSWINFACQAKSKNKHYKSEKEIRLLAVSNSSWGSYTNSPEMYCDQPAIYFRDHNMFNTPIPYVKFFIPKKSITRKELGKKVKNKSRFDTKQLIRKMEEEQGRELLPIDKVIIGPMQHQEEEVYATKLFLLENGYDKVSVIPSDIPFRGK